MRTIHCITVSTPPADMWKQQSAKLNPVQEAVAVAAVAGGAGGAVALAGVVFSTTAAAAAAAAASAVAGSDRGGGGCEGGGGGCTALSVPMGKSGSRRRNGRSRDSDAEGRARS